MEFWIACFSLKNAISLLRCEPDLFHIHTRRGSLNILHFLRFAKKEDVRTFSVEEALRGPLFLKRLRISLGFRAFKRIQRVTSFILQIKNNSEGKISRGWSALLFGLMELTWTELGRAPRSDLFRSCRVTERPKVKSRTQPLSWTQASLL